MVLGVDHYCFWVGSPVGLRNRKCSPLPPPLLRVDRAHVVAHSPQRASGQSLWTDRRPLTSRGCRLWATGTSSSSSATRPSSACTVRATPSRARPSAAPSASFLARPFGSVTPRRGKPLLTPRTKAAADEAGGGERPRGARPTSPLALVHGSTLPLALLQARSPSAMRSSTGCPRAATPPQMRKTDPAAPPTHTLQSAHARITAVAPSSIATPLAT